MHNIEIENQRWGHKDLYVTPEEVQKLNPKDWILEAFLWDEQQEGDDFWFYLNDKWLKIIEENKQIVWGE